MSLSPIRVLCVGAGHMGRSHALAYHKLPGFQICGLVTRSADSRAKLNAELGGGYAEFGDFHAALQATKPDAVSISSYPDTHAEYAVAALAVGCHVFVEKPLAVTVAEAEQIIAKAKEVKRKVVIGYILRHHPAWTQFIKTVQTLGKPLVMRMNLNQQSFGDMWKTHRALLQTCSPVVDCGDGSVGWYEAGWGPMMSEEAFFVKDVIGPKGCVSIVAGKASQAGNSADVDSHSAAQALKVHSSQLGPDGKFTKPDEIVPTEADPGHDGLCEREQAYFEKAIREDLDLTAHMEDAVNSMRIVAAADQSFREGRTINL
ncbi:MAG: gfo/Idh/MocA family oxidoreductase [Verrucomicrobia bacterium]|nr:gfo/Idh/MocA family oxidoreductase [Verrucomicrobiota bacterium]